MSNLNNVLGYLRDNSTSQRAKGTYFEKLCVAFLRQDPGMQQQFGKVWLYADWAKLHNQPQTDTGIDIVAEVREGGVCAAQCKFYARNHAIQKGDIDSFFTASGKHPFTRRLIFDTTEAPWSKHAEAALIDQQIPTSRLGLDRIDEAVDWSHFLSQEKAEAAPKKQPRPHQAQAVAAVEAGFAAADRGKLLMACGTGKTYTGLKVAEAIAGAGKWVLFLVPSLSLMSQSIREWTIDSHTPLRARAVCSDTEVGRRPGSKDDMAEFEAQDLDTPATTNAARFADSVKAATPDRMTVVFATYQSIQVVSAAQILHGLPEFDLIICDEAHRTTGVVFPGDDSRDSNFVKIHDQAFVRGKKRLYMTATPRIFGDAVKTKAGEESVALCSMDDAAIYGETLFERGFGWAVENGLLTDYKVIVLAVDEEMVSTGLQRRLADGSNELKLDDATKIIGCYKALTKSDLKPDVAGDLTSMHRGLAFCRDITSSKLIQNQFAATVNDFLASDEGRKNEEGSAPLTCELAHVDGTFMAKERTRLLDWLKAPPPGEVCRILTNARCLSEGVDVPALDAILFMHPRKSQIDVVQSVGRVMRRAEGKQMGYVILPIGIPSGVSAENALNDNERYRIVWQILNALRSHDERLDATINRIDLGEDVSGRIEIVAVSNKLPKQKSGSDKPNIGDRSAPSDDDGQVGTTAAPGPTQASFVFDEVSKAIMARIVKKCGKRDYWETWANDIAKIARTHITRITTIVGKKDSAECEAFQAFVKEIRSNLNDSITEADAVEMLAQHVITRPVFDALFDNSMFALSNPVSVAMEGVLAKLDDHSLDKEAESLQKFYASVRRRATSVESAGAKQRIVVELYDKFFRTAFPRTTERLGIVYTPVEIVDFLIQSVNEVLQEEFGQTLSSEGVHVIEPFAGTGTFITRLLQSGLIKTEDLRRKFLNEIHANEIVLLAYYISAINIETVYASVNNGDYASFPNICLTDTFQDAEPEDLLGSLMASNSERRKRQRELPIKVLLSNPPYSAGQKSERDNAANVAYPALDARIRSTYAAASAARLSKGLYNNYIRAIRWGTDRLSAGGGVLAFVTDAGWIEKGAMDGLRKLLAEDFSSIYVLHLRGDARQKGESRRRERDNVFGVASRQPIAICIMVKSPVSRKTGRIFFDRLGDYLSREAKLAEVANRVSIASMRKAEMWTEIFPDKNGDWLKQRDEEFNDFFALGNKSDDEGKSLFLSFSLGVVTNRDAWCINSSRPYLIENVEKTVETYTEELKRFRQVTPPPPRGAALDTYIDNFVTKDTSRISWTHNLKQAFRQQKPLEVTESRAVLTCYRPFLFQWLYYDRSLNERVYLIPKVFPAAGLPNRVIAVEANGRTAFSSLITSALPSLNILDASQCFPRYLYKEKLDVGASIEEDTAHRFERSDAITDEGLAYFRAAYPKEVISKDDLFYFTYGVLHSEDYRERFANSLSKQLPRLPLLATVEDFRSFVQAGWELGKLHIGFETQETWPGVVQYVEAGAQEKLSQVNLYRVASMKFEGRRPNLDKSTIIYNSYIKLTGIPQEAYEYVLNGRSAIEWVMEGQAVSTDKASGIVNDANDYANETIKDPAYPMKLLLSVITVSMKTLEIVRSLPHLEIMPPPEASTT